MNIKKNVFFAVMLLGLSLFGAIAAARSIEVSIAESIQSDVKLVRQSEESNFVSLNYDLFNSGSIPYGVRLRLDVNNGTANASIPGITIWSRQVLLLPGERKPEQIYWYGGDAAGNFTAKLRAYRAQEIEDVGQFAVELKNATPAKSVFTIEKARIYDDTIKLRISSASDADNIIIYPAKYPAGWLFEEEKIESIKKSEKKWVAIHYEPALFSEKGITVAIVGNNGRFYSEQTITLRKESGLSGYMHQIQDWLI